MYNNVFYYSRLCPIGGIETWLWSLGKKYGATHDITVFYSSADPEQLRRLRRVVRTEKYTGQTIQCKKAFFCYDANIIDKVEADEYFLVVHGDYKALGYPPPRLPKITRVVGVSQIVCDSYRELTEGDEIELCYNPMIVQKPKKTLRLISATRLSHEKGLDRMERFALTLDRLGVAYTWEIFTDGAPFFKSPNVFWRPRRLDVVDFIAAADYLIQLSDTEGLPYSINEALSVGTPVIVTDFPAAFEMGVKDGVNGFVLPMDFKEIPVEALQKGLKKFKYTPPADHWADLLEPGAGTYLEEIEGTVEVRCISGYYDTVRRVMTDVGEIYRVDPERAEILVEHRVAVLEPSV